MASVITKGTIVVQDGEERVWDGTQWLLVPKPRMRPRSGVGVWFDESAEVDPIAFNAFDTSTASTSHAADAFGYFAEAMKKTSVVVDNWAGLDVSPADLKLMQKALAQAEAEADRNELLDNPIGGSW